MTKTKIALIAAVLVGTSSAAFAQGYEANPNMRFPAYAAAGASMPYNAVMPVQQRSNQSIPVTQRRTFQQAPVGLYEGRSVYQGGYQGGFTNAPVSLGSQYFGGQQDEVGTDLRDRASSPYAGGVN